MDRAIHKIYKTNPTGWHRRTQRASHQGPTTQRQALLQGLPWKHHALYKVISRTKRLRLYPRAVNGLMLRQGLFVHNLSLNPSAINTTSKEEARNRPVDAWTQASPCGWKPEAPPCNEKASMSGIRSDDTGQSDVKSRSPTGRRVPKARSPPTTPT